MAKKDLIVELGSKLDKKKLNWSEERSVVSTTKKSGRGRPKMAVKRETVPLRLMPKYKKLLKTLALKKDLKYGELVEAALEMYMDNMKKK